MNEEAAGSDWITVKHYKTSAPVPPDDFVVDRIKSLKKTIGSVKCEGNKWTEMLRNKLDQDTVKDKLTGDRTFKTNGSSRHPLSSIRHALILSRRKNSISLSGFVRRPKEAESLKSTEKNIHLAPECHHGSPLPCAWHCKGHKSSWVNHP
jgi:hypothetical protein